MAVLCCRSHYLLTRAVGHVATSQGEVEPQKAFGLRDRCLFHLRVRSFHHVLWDRQQQPTGPTPYERIQWIACHKLIPASGYMILICTAINAYQRSNASYRGRGSKFRARLKKNSLRCSSETPPPHSCAVLATSSLVY